MGQHFSNFPKCNPFQSSPVLSILVPFQLFCILFGSSIVLSRYFVISGNSITFIA